MTCHCDRGRADHKVAGPDECSITASVGTGGDVNMGLLVGEERGSSKNKNKKRKGGEVRVATGSMKRAANVGSISICLALGGGVGFVEAD